MKVTTRNGKSVESPYNNAEVLDKFYEYIKSGKVKGSFAENLSDHSSHLSEEQIKWVHILVHGAEHPAVKLDKPVPLLRIMAMFMCASEDKKNVRIQLDKLELKLSGSRSKYPGSVAITDGGPYGEGAWYGRIGTDGLLVPSQSLLSGPADIRDSIIRRLRELDTDPVKAAGDYGRETGRCCFCGILIETKESLAVGYGPKCAENHGLPWG